MSEVQIGWTDPTTFRAALQAAISAGQDVYLPDTSYGLSGPIVWPTGDRVSHVRGRRSSETQIVALWTEDLADANDPLLGMFRGHGAPALLTSTLAAPFPCDSWALTLATLGEAYTAGDEIELYGHNGGDDGTGQEQQFMSSGPFITLDELCRVADADGAAVTLAGSTRQFHASTNQGHGEPCIVRRVQPVGGIELHGLTLVGGERMPVGVSIQRATDIVLEDVALEGFSHTGIYLGAVRDFELSRIMHLGGSNGLVEFDSAIAGCYRRIRSRSHGARFHADGIIGGLLRFTNRCSDILGTDVQLARGCQGIRYLGGQRLVLVGGHVADMHIHEMLAREPDTVVGVGLSMGIGPVPHNEKADGLLVSAVQFSNCRGPLQLGAQECQCYTIWDHDAHMAHLGDCQAINVGHGHYDVHGGVAMGMRGIGTQDCGGVVVGWTSRGVEDHFSERSGDGVLVVGAQWYGVHGVATTPAAHAIIARQTAAHRVAFFACEMANLRQQVYPQDSQAPTHQVVEQCNYDYGGVWAFTSHAINASGDTMVVGQLVQIRPGLTPSELVPGNPSYDAAPWVTFAGDPEGVGAWGIVVAHALYATKNIGGTIYPIAGLVVAPLPQAGERLFEVEHNGAGVAVGTVLGASPTSKYLVPLAMGGGFLRATRAIAPTGGAGARGLLRAVPI